MSAQPDLFGGQAAPADEIVINLRERSAWRSIRNPKDPDQYLPAVVESFCGRYTITWTQEHLLADGQRQCYTTFRRQFEVNRRTGELQRSHPIVISGHDTPEQAREACAVHAEANP